MKWTSSGVNLTSKIQSIRIPSVFKTGVLVECKGYISRTGVNTYDFIPDYEVNKVKKVKGEDKKERKLCLIHLYGNEEPYSSLEDYYDIPVFVQIRMHSIDSYGKNDMKGQGILINLEHL